MKLREIFGQPEIKALPVTIPLEFQRCGIPLLKSNTLLGLEVELEGFKQSLFLKFPHNLLIKKIMALKADGSLRDNGMELVSGVLTPKTMGYALFLLQEFNNFMSPVYSPRTGIHVHLNVTELDSRQLLTFFAIYTLVEDSLFKISGDRGSNIFCLPVQESLNGIPELFVSNGVDYTLSRVAQRGEKYLALNYKPLISFGTLEFRHMAGTGDIHKIAFWINLILSLYNFSEANPWDIGIKEKLFALNSNSLYRNFGQEVFGDLFVLLIHIVGEEFFSKGVEKGVGILKEWSVDTASNLEMLKKKQLRKPPLRKSTKVDVFDDIMQELKRLP